MGKRKSMSKRMRFEIFKRDCFTCQYCGEQPPKVVLVIDHIVPVAGGGGNEDHNLITSCHDCNAGKSDRPLGMSPPAIQEQLKDRIERAEQLEEYNKYLLELRKRHEQVVHGVGVYWCDSINTNPEEKGKWVVCGAWLKSLQTFLKYLPAAILMEAMDIAVARRRPVEMNDNQAWRNFCGICWKQIKEKYPNG